MMRAVLSCRESARLASEAQNGRLPRHLRIGLRLHLMMCAGCRAYTRQIQGLATLLRTRALKNDGLLASPEGLRPEERDRIRAALDQSGADAGADADADAGADRSADGGQNTGKDLDQND